MNFILFEKRYNVERVCRNVTAIVANHTFDPERLEGTTKNWDGPKRWTNNQINLDTLGTYSGNNHLVRISWYKKSLEVMGFMRHPPEFVIMNLRRI